MLCGSLVLLVIPFRISEIDDDAFLSLLEWHTESGSHGIPATGPEHAYAPIEHNVCRAA